MSVRFTIAILLGVPIGAFQPCPPDRNGDGHPIFGVLAQRAEFEPQEDTPGDSVTGLDFGDLDGDGDLDAVGAAGLDVGHLGVLFNDGDGLLTRLTLYETGGEATTPVLADFDGDGDLDCAVTCARDDSVWVFINDGSGVFVVGETMAAGDEPRSLVAGDLNGDGLADLVVLNTLSSDVSVFLNRGNAIFELSATIDVPDVTPRGDSNRTFPIPGPFLAIGDVDGDGDLDLAIPTERRPRLLINDGSGSFTLAAREAVAVPRLLYALEFADLDGDGDLDLGGTIFGGQSLMAIWINDDGHLRDPVIYDSSFARGGYFNAAIAFGDIDGDGDLDAALANSRQEAHVTHRNNGDGTFAPYEVHRIDRGPWIVDLVDLNGDNLLDFVGTVYDARTIIVTKLNDGEGGFFTTEGLDPIFERSITYGTMDVGDIDLDGDLDIALGETSANTPNQIRIMANNGAGIYEEIFVFTIGPQGVAVARDLVLADLNNDGLADLALAVANDRTDPETPGSVFIAQGRGDGSFDTPVRYPLDDMRAINIAIADIDADDDLDLLVTVVEVQRDFGIMHTRGLHVMLNDGDGVFPSAYDIPLVRTLNAIPLSAVGVGDLDGDGDIDAIVSTGDFRDPAWAFVLLNDGEGILTLEQTIDLTMNPYALGVADLDGDGAPDAAIAHWVETFGGPYLTILSNDGTGHLAISETHTDINLELTANILIDDVNADGTPDIFVAPDSGGAVVHLNDAKGSFTNRAWYHTHSAMSGMALYDLDGDGDKDLIGATYQGGLDPLFVLRQVGCNCRADLSGDGELSREDFFLYLELFGAGDERADLTGDGTLDSDDFFGFLDLYAEGCEG